MSVRVLPRLLPAVVVGVVVVGVGCLSEIAAPGCRGPTCKVVDDNAEPPRLFVDPPFGLGFDCVTLGCDVERRMVVENRGGGTISLALARLSVDTSTDFSLRTASAPLPFDDASAIDITVDTPLELFVRYVPGDGNADDGTVLLNWHDATVAFDDAVLEVVELPLSSRALGDAVAVTDTTRLNFGFVPVGGYATRAVNFTNAGSGGVLSVGPVSLEDGTGPVFAEPVAGAWTTLFANPGEAAAVLVNFRPDAVGTFTGAILVQTNDGAAPAIRVEVAGTAVAEPDAVPASRALDFQAIRVGTSRTLPLVIHNAGGTPLTLQGSVQSGAGLTLGTTEPIVVPPLESATVPVTWSPTTGGGLTGRLVFATNDPAEASISIDVTGFANAPQLAVSPLNIDFGSVVQGWTTEGRSFVLSNSGFGELTISTIAFDVGSSSQIRFVEVPNLPVKLSPGDPGVIVTVVMEASTLGTIGAAVLVGTDGVDGPVGLGGVGRLQVGGVVVTCEQGCPVSNGTPSCGTGECRIGSCINRFHDADNGFGNGCECGEDLVPGGAGTRRDVGGTCGGLNIGPLGDDCASVREVRVGGTLHDEQDVDLYFFRATDESRVFGCDGFGDSFGVRIRLEGAPSGARLCARQADDGVGCGGENQRRCVNAGSDIFFGGGNQLFGGSDTSDVTVWVEWQTGAAPQCGSYTLFVKGNDG
jgi:hypothetical protein